MVTTLATAGGKNWWRQRRAGSEVRMTATEQSKPGMPAQHARQPEEHGQPDQQVADEAGHAVEQAREKAGEAVEHGREKAESTLRQKVNERRSELADQVSSAADDLKAIGKDLEDRGRKGAARLADQAAEKAEHMGGYLRQSEPDQIVSDIEDAVRRRPSPVVVGGVVLGFAASRFLKASRRGGHGEQRHSQARTEARPTAADIVARPSAPAPSTTGRA
jgi:hypothetical protein